MLLPLTLLLMFWVSIPLSYSLMIAMHLFIRNKLPEKWFRDTVLSQNCEGQ